MQIKKRIRKINKPSIIVTTVLLAGVVIFLSYTFILKSQNDSNTDNVKSDNRSSDAQQSKNLSENPDNKTKAPNADTPVAPLTTTGSNKKQVQMVASVDRSNGTVFIRGGVNYPVTGGNCFAKLSGPSGQSMQKDSVVLSNPNSTDCRTISIPEGDLASGKWTFTLNYTSDKYEGASSEVSFTL